MNQVWGQGVSGSGRKVLNLNRQPGDTEGAFPDSSDSDSFGEFSVSEEEEVTEAALEAMVQAAEELDKEEDDLGDDEAKVKAWLNNRP